MQVQVQVQVQVHTCSPRSTTSWGWTRWPEPEVWVLARESSASRKGQEDSSSPRCSTTAWTRDGQFRRHKPVSTKTGQYWHEVVSERQQVNGPAILLALLQRQARVHQELVQPVLALDREGL